MGMNILKTLQTAFSLHNSGQLEEAGGLYKKILKIEKNNPDANHLLGVLEYQTGNFDAALKLIRKAIKSSPDSFSYYRNLGLVCHKMGRMDEAVTAFRRSIRLHSNQPDTLCDLSNVLLDLKLFAEAEFTYKTALGLSPRHAKAFNGLGNAFEGQGNHENAIDAYNNALQIDPDYVLARYNLANAYQQNANHEAAEAAYRIVIHKKPDFAEAYNNLGIMQRSLGRIDEAEDLFSSALKYSPGKTELYISHGETLQHQGKQEEAIASYQKALAINPSCIAAYWGEHLMLPALYSSTEQIEDSRHEWIKGVHQLLAKIDLKSKRGIREAKVAANTFPNFYLNYQGYNDRDAQTLYGALLSRIAHAAYPEYTHPKIAAVASNPARIRVGFVSSCFYNHSIFKTHGHWITKLNPDEFDVHVFYLGAINDWATKGIASRANRFVSIQNVDKLISAIASQDLDILVYPDLGMDPQLQLASALRLATIQCNGGGHPITSGLKTIDYFLGSDLMEPANGQDHYTEKLIRLPNLASSYPHPDVENAKVPMTARRNRGAIVYLNLQSLFKLLPQHDIIYPQIAKQVPDCKFWFLSGLSEYLTAQFAQRMRSAFAREGMNSEEHCVMHPRMRQYEFFGLAKSADIILDGIAWSGNNSSLEALAFDKPIVTLPGEFFRNRHSYGILKKIGVENTIASDLDDYIRVAVELGRDETYRKEVTERIAKNKYRAYEDTEVVSALEDFFKSAVSN